MKKLAIILVLLAARLALGANASIPYDPDTGLVKPPQLPALHYDFSNVAVVGVASVYSAESHGAVHNGSTDDTTAIQAALNQAHTAGGGRSEERRVGKE